MSEAAGKIALITGANKGIGLETARQLGKLGATILLGARDLAKGEQAAEVEPFDQELMDAFKTLRRKLSRWSQDNGASLRNAKPLVPAGFATRPRANAKLLLAIGELAVHQR